MPDETMPDNKSESPKQYKLPHVTTFDGVNKNFDTLSDFVTGMLGEMREHSETTNQNLSRLAEETSENLNKLAGDMKSILSSQAMVLTICIIAVFFVIVIIKGMFDAVSGFFL